MKTVINYLLTILFALLLITTNFLLIANNTVLSSNYILAKLEKNNYYDEIYNLVESNFEKYIYQSGLDESVIKNVVTKEKIKSDTKIIIENIYENKNTEIDTNEIKNNINNNIENAISTPINKEAINTFIEHICNEYKISISYHSSIAKIGENYANKMEIISLVKVVIFTGISIDFILLFMINFKRIYKFVSFIGIAFLVNGFSFLGASFFIKNRIKINTITVLNDSISKIIRIIFSEILSNIRAVRNSNSYNGNGTYYYCQYYEQNK